MRKRLVKNEVRTPSWLVAGPLVLAFVASIIWGLVSVVPLVPALLMASEIDDYRPARFVVEEVVYLKYRHNLYRYYAKGRVDGQPEVFELYDVAPILETREALEKHFGQQPVTFDVMYNPTRMRAQSNDGSMRTKREDGSTRVLPAREGFAESYRREAWRAGLMTLGSFVVAALALMTFLWMSEGRRKK